MSLPSGWNDVKQVGIYCYSPDEKGSIDINFNIKESGNYNLKITEKDLHRMIDAIRIIEFAKRFDKEK